MKEKFNVIKHYKDHEPPKRKSDRAESGMPILHLTSERRRRPVDTTAGVSGRVNASFKSRIDDLDVGGRLGALNAESRINALNASFNSQFVDLNVESRIGALNDNSQLADLNDNSQLADLSGNSQPTNNHKADKRIQDRLSLVDLTGAVLSTPAHTGTVISESARSFLLCLASGRVVRVGKKGNVFFVGNGKRYFLDGGMIGGKRMLRKR